MGPREGTFLKLDLGWWGRVSKGVDLVKGGSEEEHMFKVNLYGAKL